MTRWLLLALLGVAPLALAQGGSPADGLDPAPTDGGPPAESRPPEAGPPAEAGPGPLVIRVALTFDVSRSFNLGGMLSGGVATVGVNAGVGYQVMDRLTADLDLAGALSFTSPGSGTMELIPGVRFSPIRQLQLHFGFPVPLVPSFGVGLLGGAAFVQRLAGSVELVVGADYAYFLTDANRLRSRYGRIQAHAGLQVSF